MPREWGINTQKTTASEPKTFGVHTLTCQATYYMILQYPKLDQHT